MFAPLFFGLCFVDLDYLPRDGTEGPQQTLKSEDKPLSEGMPEAAVKRTWKTGKTTKDIEQFSLLELETQKHVLEMLALKRMASIREHGAV